MAKFLLICFFLVGCASNGQVKTVDRSTSTTFSVEKTSEINLSAVEVNSKNQKILEEKLDEVLNFCLPRLSGYEKLSAEQAKKAYWISMSGLIAGTVLVPTLSAANATANAASIAGLGGWAGATNFAGQALKTSGLSGSSIAETRNSIIKNVKEAIAIASDGSKSFDERRGALMRARSECIVYEIAVPVIPQSE